MAKKKRRAANTADHNTAKYLSLDFNPVTEVAKTFGAKLGKLIVGSNKKPQGRGRPIQSNKVARAALSIVAEIIDVAKGNIERSVHHGLSPNKFTGQPVSHKHFKRAIKGLEDLKFLKRTPGHWHKKGRFSDLITPDSGFGRETRWRPTQKLIDLCEAQGITSKNITKHFEIQLPKYPLELRQSSKRVNHLKAKGKKVHFPQTKTSIRLNGEIKEINLFLKDFKLTGASHRGYRRIFNLGDNLETYAWNKGGRLYGSGGEDNYLTIKKAERQKILINGQETVEIDIRASFMNIFHSLNGVDIDVDKDPYVVEGLPRDIVKKWVVAAFGMGKPPNRWSHQFGKEYVETQKSKRKLGDVYPMKLVTPLILKALPVLQKLELGGVDCFDLMYLESNAMVASMLRLLREYQAPSFSVHDSLIVRKRDQALAMKILKVDLMSSPG